jgi:hypothetical protein
VIAKSHEFFGRVKDVLIFANRIRIIDTSCPAHAAIGFHIVSSMCVLTIVPMILCDESHGSSLHHIPSNFETC